MASGRDAELRKAYRDAVERADASRRRVDRLLLDPHASDQDLAEADAAADQAAADRDRLAAELRRQRRPRARPSGDAPASWGLVTFPGAASTPSGRGSPARIPRR